MKPIDSIKVWVEEVPDNAFTLRVTARHMGGAQPVCELTREEVNEKGIEATTERVIRLCEMYTDGLNKEVRYLGVWLGENDRVLTSMNWIIMPKDGGLGNFPIDGTPEAWLAQMQAFAAQKDKAMIDMFKAFSELTTAQLSLMREKLDALEGRESEIRELREMLIEAKRDGGTANPLVEARVNKVITLIEHAIMASLAENNPRG